MSLSKQNPLMETPYPLLYVQDVKDSGNDSAVGHGFASTTVDASFDITYIQHNDIPNATLTVSGSTSGAAGTFPNSAATGSTVMFNNLSAGVHHRNCYVTLPEGVYAYECSEYDAAPQTTNIGIYNLTDGEWLVFPGGLPASNGNGGIINGRFSISGIKNIEIRKARFLTVASPTASDMGGNRRLANVGVKCVGLDVKFYKIG